MLAAYAHPPASAADVRTGDLAPSKTHQKRAWAFVPAADPTRPEVGTLTVAQGRELVTYLVGLSDDQPEVYFAKQDAAAEVYAVRLADGKPAGCTCPGWRFKGTCKHVDATAAAVLPLLVTR